MKIECVKKIFFLCVFLGTAFSLGCDASPKNSVNKNYGEDAQYFFGLEHLKNKNEEAAKKCFLRCVQKGSFFPARRSFEELCKIGSVQEQIKRCGELVKKYGDDEAKLLACKIFVKNSEFNLALSATEGIDLAAAPNELVLLRLELLAKNKDPRLQSTICDWFSGRRISSEHYDFFQKNAREELAAIVAGEGDLKAFYSDFPLNVNFMERFRVEVYKKNFSAAFEMLNEIREITIARNTIALTYQIVSDMGKACLNGSREYSKNAEFFVSLAQNEKFKKNKKIKYYAKLYAGLLYSKNANDREKAAQQFEQAVSLATQNEECDQALWHFFQTSLKISLEKTLQAIKKYREKWSDVFYFDDFFDSLCMYLISSSKWKTVQEVFELVKDYASPPIVSRFAYLTARSIQEGFAKGSEQQMQAALKAAIQSDCGTYVYYKLLAAKQLGFSIRQIDEMFFGNDEKQNPEISKSQAALKKAESEKAGGGLTEENFFSARRLLLGYADFGFAEKIFGEWQKFFEQDDRSIDMETAEKLSAFLKNLDDGKNGFLPKSLRIISKTANVDGQKISRLAFTLIFPQNFAEYVNSACKEFGIDPHVMYALIRTESYFDVKAKSHAGALGLTQLMRPTASECASRLSVRNYDLFDAATNIRFGTYYFSTMVSRLDDSHILALFAYNAGIGNVRRWIRTSKIQFDAKGKISSDLFLETLPFAETRDYGRRVTSIAAMYAWLYEGKNPCDIVATMM